MEVSAIAWACALCSRGPFHARSLFGIAPGGACHAVLVAKTAVGSYPTVSPSPQIREARCPTLRQSLLCGAFPRVAPAGRYPAPFLHGVRTFLGASPAVIQPSAHFGHICKVARRQAKNNSGPAIAMKRYYRRYLFAISDHHPRHLVCQRAILGGLVPLCKGTKTKSKGIKRRLCICVGIANSG